MLKSISLIDSAAIAYRYLFIIDVDIIRCCLCEEGRRSNLKTKTWAFDYGVFLYKLKCNYEQVAGNEGFLVLVVGRAKPVQHLYGLGNRAIYAASIGY